MQGGVINDLVLVCIFLYSFFFMTRHPYIPLHFREIIFPLVYYTVYNTYYIVQKIVYIYNFRFCPTCWLFLYFAYIETVQTSDSFKQSENLTVYVYQLEWARCNLTHAGDQYEAVTVVTNSSSNMYTCGSNFSSKILPLLVMCSVLSFLIGNASGIFLLYICKMCFEKLQHPKTNTKVIAMQDNAAYCTVSYHHT